MDIYQETIGLWIEVRCAQLSCSTIFVEELVTFRHQLSSSRQKDQTHVGFQPPDGDYLEGGAVECQVLLNLLTWQNQRKSNRKDVDLSRLHSAWL